MTLLEFPAPLVTTLKKSPAPLDAAPAEMLLMSSLRGHMRVSFHDHYAALPLPEGMLYSGEKAVIIRVRTPWRKAAGSDAEVGWFLSDMTWALRGPQVKHSTGLQLEGRARHEHGHFKAILGMRRTTDHRKTGEEVWEWR